MNEAERTELQQLKDRQERLEQELLLLGRQLVRLEQRLSSASAVREPLPRTTSQPAPIVADQPTAPTPTPAQAPQPPVIHRRPVVPQDHRPVEPAPAPAPVAASRPVPPALAASIIPPTPAAPKEPRSLELRLGTFWLVRVGIALVLTALAFFGNWAYHEFIFNMGPGGKVALLYLVSGTLLGFGAWWQRRPVSETLRNYAQVLFAGGLAAVYFTTYAAHHLHALRIISSPVVDGLLLLAWAGFMVWIADRRKSEVLALFAVLLAYYTSVITRVGAFTLYSNLVLAVAAVFFLVRNRWAALSFLSLAATYAAYGFWRFFSPEWQWHLARPDQGLWEGTWFLMSYWLVFTAAVFLSKEPKFAGQNRASFLTLNNGAFFAMFVLTMFLVRQGGFWKVCLIYGTVLLVLAELARRVLADEPLARDFYLTQGLLLVTIGFISKFSGLQLALILASQSVVLLKLGQVRRSVILLIGAYISAALAVGWGMDGMRQEDPHGLYLGIGLGALMMVNALLAHRQMLAGGTEGARTFLSAGGGTTAEADKNVRAPSSATILRPQVGYFAALALAVWVAATWDNCHEHFPLVLAAEGLVLTFSIYLLGLPEVSLLAQAYIIIAQLTWHFQYADTGQLPPWWDFLVQTGIVLGLSHWWQRQKVLKLPGQARWFWQALYAAAIVGLLYTWIDPRVARPTWLVLTSLLAVGLTAYGVSTRAWFLASAAQFFIVVTGVQFIWQLSQTKPDWPLPLAPIAALGLLSFATVEWFRRKPGTHREIQDPLLGIALFYRWVALCMSLWWVCAYVNERERIWVLVLLNLLVFLWAGWRKNQEALLFSGAYLLAGMAFFWLPLTESPVVYGPNLLAVLVVLVQQQIASRNPDRYRLDARVHAALILLGGVSLWRLLSLWVEENASGFYLTASWSALALVLFGVGIALRERVYRWFSLAVLAAALGRVVVLDVWKLEALYRILSFMALGVVLLVLGFVYSKYQERIREWL